MMCRSLLALGLFSLLMAGPAAGQTVPDSSRVSYSEEAAPDPQPPQSVLEQQYRRLIRVQVEEQQMWKLGLNNFTTTIGTDSTGESLYYLRAGPHLTYERKLRPAWSVMAELSPDFIRFRDRGTGRLRNSFVVRSQLAGRYYYNLARRIRKGKSASNFSANYLSLALGSSVGRQAQETPFFAYEYGGPAVRLDAALLYGLQRRLGRYGFVDFTFGFPFHVISGTGAASASAPNTVIVLLRIGLALGR
ncbi:hypothetical protein [Hymenobacter antarcticus]